MQQGLGADVGDEQVEQLIAGMQHGIHICAFPAGSCVYCDRDTRCIALLRELLALRRRAAGLADAA